MYEYINNLLLINNKHYQVIWEYSISDELYLYLINQNDYNDILFVKITDNEVEIVNDKETLAYIIKKMSGDVNKIIL